MTLAHYSLAETVLTRMAMHSTLPLLMELRKETKLSSEPGMYVSNTRTAISLPWKGTRMINRAHTHTHNNAHTVASLSMAMWIPRCSCVLLL